MVNESSQPKPGDAVLGGNNPPPINAAVLGGIEGTKQRCASPDVQARIAGLREAVKYGEAGIELLVHGLKDEVSEVGLAAYSLLQENAEPELKRVLEIDEPYQLWEAKASNTNIVDSVELFHSYMKIKQPQNSSLHQAFQALNRGTKAEQNAVFIQIQKNSSLYQAFQLLNLGTKAERNAAFSQLQSSQEPAIEAALRLYINELYPKEDVTYSRLKYLLDIKQWQSAQEETEDILIQLSGCPKGTAISEILKSELTQSGKSYYGNSYRYVKRKISTDELRFIYEIWQKSVKTSSLSSEGAVTPDFLVSFKGRLNQIISEDEEGDKNYKRFQSQEQEQDEIENARASYSGDN